MEIVGLVGGIIALIAFIPLFIDIESGGVRLNLATWLIWTVVDTILLLAIISAHGSALFLSSAFVLGDIIVVCMICSSRIWHWRLFETLTTTAAAVALAVWWFAGAESALISIVLIKYFIAMAPSLRDGMEKPERKQVLPWVLFTVGIALNVISAGAWSMTNSFYPSVAFVMNGTLAILHTRKAKHPLDF